MWKLIDQIPGLLMLALLFASILTSYELTSYVTLGLVFTVLWEIYVFRRDKYEQNHPARTRTQIILVVIVARLIGLCLAAVLSILFVWTYNLALGNVYSWMVMPLALLFMGALWLLWRGSNNSKSR